MPDLQPPTKSFFSRIAEKKINRIHNDLLSHANNQHHQRAVEAATGFLERANTKLEKTQGADPENTHRAELMLERAIRKFKQRPDYDDEKEIPLDHVSDFLDSANVTSFLSENITGSPPSKKYPPSGGRRRGRHSG